MVVSRFRPRTYSEFFPGLTIAATTQIHSNMMQLVGAEGLEPTTIAL
jgi:hypothetical protein